MGEVVESVVVAIDGGGSKTDAVAITLAGRVVGRASGPGASPHFIGVDAARDGIDALVRQVVGRHPVVQANVYLSGLDLPSEVATFAGALAPLDWTSAGTVVENDLFALLRTGTAAPDAVAVVCGTGINAIGRRADGTVARFAALGTISGDWGGGTGLGEAAIWHSARHADRRGPSTSLTDDIPRHFALRTMDEVTRSLHLGTIAYSDLAILAPVVEAHSDAGDAIARRLIERQGEEIALMAASCLDRLEMLDADVPVVLGGGIIAGRNRWLWSAMTGVLRERAPRAIPVHVAAPPIVGAALLALECAETTSQALELAVAGLA